MILLNNSRLHRTIKRMAFQVVEEAGGEPIIIVGLNERGFSVASLMDKFIQEEGAAEVNLLQLFVEEEKELDIEKPIPENSILVIVDDVIFSGITMFNALESIPELTSFKNVYVAAVVDRGHRKVPVQAGIVGVTIPTKLNEHVDFRLSNNKPKEVLIAKQ